MIPTPTRLFGPARVAMAVGTPLLAVIPATGAHAYNRKFTEAEINRVSGVFEYWVVLQPGTNLIWTENLVAAAQCSPDAVMHVAMYPLSGHPTLQASNDDCVGGWPATGLNPCIAFNNPESITRLAKVTVHGYQTCSASTGTFRFVSSASNITTSGTFGGQVLTATQNQLGWSSGERIEVVRPVTSTPIGASYRVHVIRAPSGSCGYNDIQLADGTLLTSPGGGVSMAMGWSSASYCQVRLVVGHSSTLVSDHQARIYINDVANDTDGDGLGDQLEASLQTCASDTCAWSLNAQDTDHDGLKDGWEVLGVSGQRLPAWGADPRRKDAFVEIDWQSSFATSPMTPPLAVLAWQPYDTGGDPASIDNPDGSAGLQVHFDIGTSACDSIGLYCSGIYGSWGGANASTETDYETARSTQLTSIRHGLFLYGLLGNYAGGSSKVWVSAFGVGAATWISLSDLGRAIAHELGHLMGLQHWGDNDDIALDCKPNYPSLMNYAYTMSPPYFFSDGGRDPIESTAVSEQTLGGNVPSFLTTYFGLTANGQTVDWNRDGVIESVPVRAVTRRGKLSDFCDTGQAHKNEDFSNLDDQRTPALVEFQGVLHAFYVDKANDLWHATFDSTLDPCAGGQQPPACCPSGSSAINDCNAWSSPTLVPTGGDLTSSPTAVVVETNPPKIALAYSIGTSGARQFRIRSLTAAGTFTSERGMALQPLSTTFPTRVDGTLVYRRSPVSPATIRLQFYYLGYANQVRQANLYENYETSGPVVVDRFLVDSRTAATIYSRHAPGATRYTPFAAWDRTYLLTVNTAFKLSLYYIDVDEQAYRRLDGGGNDVFGAVTFNASGAPSIIQESEIAEGLEVFFPGGSTIRRTWAPHAASGDFIFDRNIYGGLGNRIRAGLAIYQGRLQLGTSCEQCDGATPLQHEPFASGVVALAETDNDDFVTMARDLCTNLRNTASSDPCLPCAPAGTNCGAALTWGEEVKCSF